MTKYQNKIDGLTFRSQDYSHVHTLYAGMETSHYSMYFGGSYLNIHDFSIIV